MFRVNMRDGSLTEVSKTGPEVDDLNCDGMCTSADGRLLYAVNQVPALGGKPGASVNGGTIGFQTGLEFLSGAPKPLYHAWPVPLVVSKSGLPSVLLRNRDGHWLGLARSVARLCSFCRRRRSAARPLVEGHGANVCGDCLRVCREILEGRAA